MRYFIAAVMLICFLLINCAPATKPEIQKTTTELIGGTEGVVEAYRAWAITQTDELVAKTEAFAAAVSAGNRTKAQALYAPARMHFERIEPIAEALGDLDPQIDAREGDVADDQWRGFHKLEKLLWSADPLGAGDSVAKELVVDIHRLRAKVETAEISLASMVVGAVELLNEVSTTKVTGEEERYSHTDLWDFQGNVEGAAKIFELLMPAVEQIDSALATTLKQRFSLLFSLLDSHKKGEGYKLYGELKPQEVKDLSTAVDGVAEPLSHLGKYFSVETGAK